MKVCSTRGCVGRHVARGLCRRCYVRRWRNGSLVTRPQQYGPRVCSRCGKVVSGTSRGLCVQPYGSCYRWWWTLNTVAGRESRRHWHRRYAKTASHRRYQRDWARERYRRDKPAVLKKLRHGRKTLANWYLSNLLRRVGGTRFPSVLLEAKRAQLKLKRLVKDLA